MRDEERKELARRAISGDADALLDLVDRAVHEAVSAAVERHRREEHDDESLEDKLEHSRLKEEMLEFLRGARRVGPEPRPEAVREFVGLTYATNTANLRACPVCGASPPCAQDCR